MLCQDRSLLIECHPSYETNVIKNRDVDGNLRQRNPFISIDYDELINFTNIGESDGEHESSDFNMVNRDLADFNVVSNGDSNHISVLSATILSL